MANKRTAFKIPDLLVCVLCVSGIACSLFFLWTDVYKTFLKQNEKPVAEIRFVEKTVQRRFFDRSIWDILRDDAMVYNGDIIRTAPFSRVRLVFQDGKTIDLFENTLVQIFAREEQKTLDIQKGRLVADFTLSAAGMEITSLGRSVQLPGGSKVSAAVLGSDTVDSGGIETEKETETFSLTVLAGSVSVSNEAETFLIAPGTAFVYSVQENALFQAPLAVLEPPPETTVSVNYGESSSSVAFRWNTPDRFRESGTVIELYRDSGFSQLIFSFRYTQTDTAPLDFLPGTTYWKAFIQGNEAFAATGRVIVETKPEEFPVSALTAINSDAPETAETALPSVEASLPRSERVLPQTEHVSAPPVAAKSDPPAFQALSPPVLLEPSDGTRLNAEQLYESRSIRFRWTSVEHAGLYLFILKQVRDGNDAAVILTHTGADTAYALTDLSLLDNGVFVWSVEAQAAGYKSGMAVSSFSVQVQLEEQIRANAPGTLFGQ